MRTIAINENFNKISKYLGNANTMVDNANSLLDYFLTGPTMRSGQLSISKAKFNMHDFLTEIVTDLRFKHPTHQLILRNATDLSIIADKERIGQVVRNLLTNVIKYSLDQEVIIISCKLTEDHVHVSIKDNGPGIPSEHRHRIFNKYYRINNPAEEAIPGLGIGLYICKHIIDEHNGKIWFKSKVSKGSTFFFSLPII